MEQVAFTGVVIILCIIIYLIYRTYKFSQWECLHKKICWCTSEDSRVFRSNMDLIHYINNLTISSRAKNKSIEDSYYFHSVSRIRYIDQKYQIVSDEEKDIAREILKFYQAELSQSYLTGKILPSKHISKLTDAEYFVLSLLSFLDKHQCDTEINDIKMHQRTISHQSYGSWGGPLYDAKYELSEFALVYHKLLLTALEYNLAMQKNLTSEDTIYHNAIQNVKNIIDTNQIEVSCY